MLKEIKKHIKRTRKIYHSIAREYPVSKKIAKENFQEAKTLVKQYKIIKSK